MNPFDALSHMPELVADYKATAQRLIEAEREITALKTDKYVSLEWVAEYWSVETKTARQMLQHLTAGRAGKTSSIKTLSYGPKIVRYRRRDIEAITEANLVPLSDMLALKRAGKDRVAKDQVAKDKARQGAQTPEPRPEV